MGPVLCFTLRFAFFLFQNCMTTYIGILFTHDYNPRAFLIEILLAILARFPEEKLLYLAKFLIDEKFFSLNLIFLVKITLFVV